MSKPKGARGGRFAGKLDPDAAEEGSDPATFLVVRTGAADTPLTVNYLLGGAAGNGVDTNENAADWFVATPNPQNLTALLTPPPAPAGPPFDDLVTSLVDNAMESHDDQFEGALFAASATNGFLSLPVILTENGEFNGPLMLVPGSHHYFVLCVGRTPQDNYKESLKSQCVGVPDNASLRSLMLEGDIEAPKGGAGSLVLFECNTLHGSNINMSCWPRSNLFFVYNSIENGLHHPFCGNRPRPEFLANANSLSLVAAYGTFPVGSALFAFLATVASWLGRIDALQVLERIRGGKRGSLRALCPSAPRGLVEAVEAGGGCLDPFRFAQQTSRAGEAEGLFRASGTSLRCSGGRRVALVKAERFGSERRGASAASPVSTRCRPGRPFASSQSQVPPPKRKPEPGMGGDVPRGLPLSSM